MTLKTFAIAVLLQLTLGPLAWATSPDLCVKDELESRLQLADKAALIKHSAQQVTDFILEFKRLPSRASNETLFVRMTRYRNDPEFANAIKENPEAWKIYEELHRFPGKNTALETIEYTEKYKNIPNETSNKMLFDLIFKYREDQAFLDTLKENKQAWKLFRQRETSRALATRARLIAKPAPPSPPKAAALDFITFALKPENGKTAPTRKTDKKLFDRLTLYQNNPEFIDTVQRNKKAWAIYEENWLNRERRPRGKKALQTDEVGSKPNPALAKSAIHLAARRIVEYTEEKGRLPSASTNLELYTALYLYKDDPEFIQLIQQSPKTWALFQKLPK